MLALAMIVKDEVGEVQRILRDYGGYFKHTYFVVSDKKAFDKLLKGDYPGSTFEFREWNDNFADARNHVFSLVKEPYVFWMDCDDTINRPEHLKFLPSYMEARELDAVFMKYDYAHNEQGESIADHWRERIIRTGSKPNWIGAVHETIDATGMKTERIDGISIVHNKSPEELEKSLERNISILKKDWDDNEDPRSAHYLGMSYMGQKQYEKAFNWFLKHVLSCGWDEEKYRSYCRMSECAWLSNKPEQALDSANSAIDTLPDRPDAYFIKAMVYNDLEDFEKTVEWVKVGMSKETPDTLSITDPTLYEYRGMFIGALAYLQLGEIEQAIKLYSEVKRRAPDYPIAKELEYTFEEAYYDHEAIKRVKWLAKYLEDRTGSKKLFEALPKKLSSDPRLNSERVKAYPPKKWPDKSIAIYCGPSSESWGPDTLDKGMGGSEEAVVYLSRELAKQGWEVTVFNDREEEFEDVVDTSSLIAPNIDEDFELKPNGIYKTSGQPNEINILTINHPTITYKPWTELNPWDEFDVFISWRVPEMSRGVKARKVCVDLHDVVDPKRIERANEWVDLFFVKSNYHRSLFPNIPDEKFVIVGNGILKEQFA